jgi:hypothetical protein
MLAGGRDLCVAHSDDGHILQSGDEEGGGGQRIQHLQQLQGASWAVERQHAGRPIAKGANVAIVD